MIFCLGEGRLERKGEGYQKNNKIFNKQVSEEEWNKARQSLPSIKLPICKWKNKEDMTDEEKEKRSGWEQMGGYLKTLSYEDAWKEVWGKMSQEDKDKILNLLHFDKKIFKSITGIDIEESDEVEIVVEGKTKKISRRSAKELNLI